MAGQGSRGESVVSPVPSGVARHWSAAYPGMESFANNTVPVGTIAMNRLSSINFGTAFFNSVIGAPPAPQGMTFYKGQVAWRLTGNATAGRVLEPQQNLTNPWKVYFQDVRGTAPMFGLDEFGCWRMAMLAAFDNPVAALTTGEIGLTFCPGANVNPRGGQPGVTFGPRAANQIGVFCRAVNAGPVTLDIALPAAFQPANMTDWHLYELRVIGADVNQEAVLKFFIDGQQVLALSWGPGTVLPPNLPDVGNRLGFHNSLGIRPAVDVGYGMWLATPGGFMISAGPTEDALL